MITIRIDLYNPGSGKWKYGGLVNISGIHYLWEDELLQEIVNNQGIVVDNALTHYDIVISEPDNLRNDPSYNGFYNQLFKAGTFSGLSRQNHPIWK